MKKYGIIIIAFLVVISIPLLLQIRSSHRHDQASGVQTAPPSMDGMVQNTAYSGKVIETMTSGGYTYVHVDTGNETIWAAGPVTEIKVGDRVSFAPEMRMTDFRSESLDRTFDVIFFAPQLGTGANTAHLPSGHPPVTPRMGATVTDFSGIEVPEGGKNIADVYAAKKDLAGKKVTVCAKVVKVTPGVMGKNWVHLRDGTGKEGENDLTVTTDAVVHTGDIVVVSGELGIDKDLGFGYVYDVIVENASVMVEQ